jgi:hypothetical protein
MVYLLIAANSTYQEATLLISWMRIIVYLQIVLSEV